MPRLHCPLPLNTGSVIELPAAAARHAQVLRLQPGMPITLFHAGDPSPEAAGEGEFDATIVAMGRQSVQVRVGDFHAVDREAPRPVHLAIGMPSNERMDWLVEKATELGVASIQPLLTERSVLRLDVERALKKQRHWEAVVISACEQCGRNRLPVLHPVRRLDAWLAQALSGHKLVLSTRPAARLVQACEGLRPAQAVTLLSGPEGGLTDAEEAAALAGGFVPVSLGPRILRAETAPLAALAALTLSL